ncbi:MAG: cobaltochelatase subunit CobN [Candidatus Pelagadaptatus aseana]
MPVKLAEPDAGAEKNILLVSMGHGSPLRVEMLRSPAENFGMSLATQSGRGLKTEHWQQLLQRFDLVLLDMINAEQSQKAFGPFVEIFRQHNAKIISVRQAVDANTQVNVSREQAQSVIDYYRSGGRENYRNMMAYMAADILQLKSAADVEFAAPTVLPNIGLYHPDYPERVTASAETMMAWLAPAAAQPVVAVAMHRSVIELEDASVVDQLLAAIEQRGAKALAFFFEGVEKNQNYTDLLMQNGKSWVDLIVGYRSIHYVDKRLQEFTELNVPVIHAINYLDGDRDAFLKDHAGVSGTMTPFFLVMPESSGVIDATILAAKGDGGRKVAIDEQLQALADRAVNHARLKHIPKAEKKLALMMWNYPPGEKNIGAAFLNVPQSLERISRALNQAGYPVTVEDEQWYIDGAGKLLRPFYRSEDASPLVQQGMADYLPLSVYQAWFEQLPQAVQQPILDRWGKPEENAMLVDYKGEKVFVIPRMQSGNLIMLPQPGRGDTAEEQSELYHSMKAAINHFYLAAYLYVRESWGADAIIHLGTHGSQEWLPGKERGLWAYDPSNLAVGNIPVVYPYIIDNVGEAMQAKRRGRATMISHLTPGFAAAGTYRELAELQELLADYTQLDEGAVKEKSRDKAIALMQTHKMLTDFGVDEEQARDNFAELIPDIQDYLQSLASMSQPLGLHTFGDVPPQDHLYTTIAQMLGDEFKDRAVKLENDQGWTIPADQKMDQNDAVKLEALPGYQTLSRFLKQGEVVEEELGEDLAKAKKYWDNFQGTEELPNLLRALDGEFIRPCNGNDPIRNPDAAPTGCNLIGFDPARVPSKAAWEVGSKLAEDNIAAHYEKHGRYPDKLAFSLWSLETMRHQGVLEAQVLRTMGVRPKWAPSGQVIGTEIIPYSELKRPRVDVALTATGLYRDAFPNVILWMAKAIDEVAKLKEDNNSLYDNAQTIKAGLLAEGVSEADADYFSTVRIFSNETGNYGTGLASATLDSGSWGDDSKMTDVYMNRMGFWFGKDAKRWSEKVENVDLYKQVLSGTDGVIFSRSSNLYALLTNDDPFQYFGGIAQAVRQIDGQTPEMFVSNLRKAGAEKAETMERFLAKELRSRYFHPRWIEQMQNEGYAGATAILDRMNNFWGWEVMAPEYVHDEQWQQFFEVYVQDSYDMGINEWFEQVHPTAQAQFLERMLEAVRKDYWAADDDTVKAMTERYIELANRYDVFIDNEAFKDYVDAKAQGFGLNMTLQPPVESLPEMAQPTQAAAQQVEGQKLEKVEQQPMDNDTDLQLYASLMASVLLILLGVWQQTGWSLPVSRQALSA